MDISTLLAALTTIQPATKNPTIDDQIKVHVACPQAAPVKNQVVNGVNVTKAREQVAGSNVDFKELRKTFNM